MSTHTITRPDALYFSNNDDANRLAAADGTALLIGFQLDQQQTVQKAFEGPQLILERLGTIDPAELAAMDLTAVEDAFRIKPAVHRFPANMAKRVHGAMQFIVDNYDGDTDRIWLEADDWADVMQRLQDLPGIGKQSAFTLSTVLAERFGLPFDGWQDKIPPFGSLSAVESPEDLIEYQARKREYKQARRAAKKG